VIGQKAYHHKKLFLIFGLIEQIMDRAFYTCNIERNPLKLYITKNGM